MSINKSRNSSAKRSLKKKLFGNTLVKRCCFCKRWVSFGLATLEHMVPLSLGGDWSIENLRVSCKSCNSERGSLEFGSFRKIKGWN